MAGIQTSIQLNDRMTPILQSITASMGLMINSCYIAQSATATAFDTASMAAAQQHIASASAELIQYQEELARTQSTPVSIPKPSWTAMQGNQVFVNTGAERFAQEFQLVNQTARQLYETQWQISAQARNLRVTPPGMLNAVAAVENRIQMLSVRVQQLDKIPINLRTDRVNNELESMRANLTQIVGVQDDLNQAMSRMDISAANAAYQRLNSAVASTERNIRDNFSAQEQFNQSMVRVHTAASGLEQSVKRYAAAILSVATAGKIISVADEVSQTTARLNLMNDGLQTTYQLQQMVFQSAQRSRAAYSVTADIVAKLGQRAKGAFASNAETVQFAENLNKQFVIAGASQQEMASASLQLTQALGSGVLRGEELNAVFEAAPNVIQTIADYMDVPIGKVRKLASDGEVTAEVVKNAMLSATDEITAQFNGMPITFAQVANSIRNQALMAFQPALQQLSAVTQTAEFQEFSSGITSAIQNMASAAVTGLDMMARAAVWAQDNWSWLAPAIMGVAAAVAFFSIATGFQAGASFLATLAICLQTAAINGLTFAIAACPIMWIAIAIGIVIAAIVAWINSVGGLKVAWLMCVNTIKTHADNLQLCFGIMSWGVQTALDNMQYAFACVKVGILNALSLLKIGGLQIIQSFINGVIDRINKLIEFANSIPGVSIDAIAHVELIASDAVANEQAKMQQRATDLANMKENNAADKKAREQDLVWQMLQADAARASREDEIRRAKKGTQNSAADYAAAGGYGSEIPAYDDIAGNTGKTAGNTAAMAKSMDMAEDDLKSLRDMAEQEVINRFTTAELTVNMGGITNQVNHQTDLDGIGSYLEDTIFEVLATAAEGVR